MDRHQSASAPRYPFILFDWGDTLMKDDPSQAGPMCEWKRVHAIEGAKDALRAIKPGRSLALATGAAQSGEADIRRALRRVGLDGSIDRIFCFANTGLRKSSAAFWLHILSALGAEAEDVLMIGDDFENDILGANGAGIRAIWLNAKSAENRRGESFDTIHSLRELPALLGLESSSEKVIRMGLPVVRFLQGVLPPKAMNRILARRLSRLKLDADTGWERFSIGGLPCHWLVPPQAQTDRVILYLHGGGFVLGPSPGHMRMAATLSRLAGIRVLMLEYRLAPEHPWPAPIDDCLSAYRWLLDRGLPAQGIGLAGDSAGGTIALSSLLCMRDEGLPLPSSAALLSPVADLRPGWKRPGFRDPILADKVFSYYKKSYSGDADPADQRVSPLLADLRGLPPLLIHAGEDEVLREDATALALAAKEAGVTVELELYPRMWHVWQLFTEVPLTGDSLGKIAGFLGREK